MRVVYGIAVSPQDDKYISVAETALDGMARAANPGAFFVDFIPICGCCVIYPALRNWLSTQWNISRTPKSCG